MNEYKFSKGDSVITKGKGLWYEQSRSFSGVVEVTYIDENDDLLTYFVDSLGRVPPSEDPLDGYGEKDGNVAWFEEEQLVKACGKHGNKMLYSKRNNKKICPFCEDE